MNDKKEFSKRLGKGGINCYCCGRGTPRITKKVIKRAIRRNNKADLTKKSEGVIMCLD